MRRNLRSTLTFILGWPLSIIALVFLAKSFLPHLPTISQNLTHINWLFVVFSLICFLIYYYTRSYIWVLILRFNNYHLDTRESLYQWSLSQLKRYIPGNIWGYIGISLHFGKKEVAKKDIASAILIESELVVLGALASSLFGLPIVAKLFNIAPILQLLAIVVSCIGIIIFLFSHKVKNLLPLPKKYLDFIFPSYSFSQMCMLLALMFVAFTSYGLGTFFVATAISYITPNLVWQYSGFFILSLLIGFLSLITPTGLGVREGAIALGLGLVMDSSLASFIAIAARALLIIAELASIVLMYLFYKVRKGIFPKVINLITRDPYQSFLIAFYILFVIYFAWISVLRYDNYYAGRFDLGNMEQTVWNTLHGRIFQLTNPNGTNIVSRLAFHADFILVLIAPLYFFWQDPRMLLILQVVVTGAGAFFVYKLTYSLLKNKPLALILAVLYLFNPSVERSVIYDFHAVTLATTFLLGAFYFLYNKKYGWFILFAILAAITKEQIWAITALFGLYAFFFQRKRVIGSIVFIFSSSMFYLLIWKFIPQAAGAQHFALSYYTNGEVTDSPTSLLKSFLFSPVKTLQLLLDPARISYLNKIFAPVGYLAIFSPLFLIFAGPDLAINLLSSKAELYQIYYQYTAAITPFIFIASIFGIRFLLKKVSVLTPFILAVYLLTAGIYTTYLFGPLPGAKEPNLDMITRTNADSKTIDRVLAAIPSQYSVTTSNSLGSHVTHRAYLFTIPTGWDNADYIIFLTNETNAYPSLAAHKQRIKELKKDPRYTKYFDDGTLIAFRKKTITAPIMN